MSTKTKSHKYDKSISNPNTDHDHYNFLKKQDDKKIVIRKSRKSQDDAVRLFQLSIHVLMSSCLKQNKIYLLTQLVTRN